MLTKIVDTADGLAPFLQKPGAVVTEGLITLEKVRVLAYRQNRTE